MKQMKRCIKVLENIVYETLTSLVELYETIRNTNKFETIWTRFFLGNTAPYFYQQQHLEETPEQVIS